MSKRKIQQTRNVLRINVSITAWGIFVVGVHISHGFGIIPGFILIGLALVMVVIALNGRLLKPGKYPMFRVVYVAVLNFLLGLFLFYFRTWYQLPLFLWGMFFAIYWILYALYLITLIRSQGELSPDE